VLVGAGDIAVCGDPGSVATAKLLDRIPEGQVFAAGDNAYMQGTPQQFRDCYDPTWGRHKNRTWPVPGNHDYETPGASGYYAYFGAAAGQPGQGYWRQTLGAWTILGINSNSMRRDAGAVGIRPATINPTPCTLAIWHHRCSARARTATTASCWTSGRRSTTQCGCRHQQALIICRRLRRDPDGKLNTAPLQHPPVRRPSGTGNFTAVVASEPTVSAAITNTRACWNTLMEQQLCRRRPRRRVVPLILEVRLLRKIRPRPAAAGERDRRRRFAFGSTTFCQYVGEATRQPCGGVPAIAKSSVPDTCVDRQQSVSR
jgi:hypothetical protein